MNSSNKVIPVILSGGSGSRLWPLSRASYPKQYLSLSNDSSKSMLQLTLERLQGLNYVDNPIVICNEMHRFILAEQLREVNIHPNSILLEPFGRNTAPAIALAAIKSMENEGDPILLVLPADHEIKNKDNFLKAISIGCKYANENRLVTFGIVPTSPETGYGYIKASGKTLSSEGDAFYIDKFIEKPDLELAKKLIKDKNFTWNSGIFLFKSSFILKELEKYCPKVLEICKKALENKLLDLDFQRLDKDFFKTCPNISIDKAVMENTSFGAVVPLDANWSDLGGWNSIWDSNVKDKKGNASSGKVILDNVENCYVRSESRLVVGIGLKDLIIVETNDALLISDKEKSQSIKSVVEKLKDNGFDESHEHKKMHRPWGNYTSIDEDSSWKVKKIVVKPKSSLSLQMHHHRAEHWIVVKGTAEVEINEQTLILSENQSTYIPLGAKHRLTNPGNINLVLIEVQSGSYLGEDDIVRFEDSYGRVDNQKKP